MSNQQTPEIPALFGAIDSVSQFDGAPVDAALLRAMALGANRLAAKGHPAFRIFGNSIDTGAGDGGTQVPGNLTAFAAPWWQPFCRAKLPVEKMPDLTTYDIRLSCVVNTVNDEVWFQFETHAQPFLFNAGLSTPTLIQVIGTGAQQNGLKPGTQVLADPGTFDEVTIWMKGLLTGRDQTGCGTPQTGNLQELRAYGAVGTLLVSGGTTWNLAGAQTWATAGSYIELLSNGNVVKTGWQVIDVPLQGVLNFVPAPTSYEIQQFSSGAAPNMTWRIRALPQIHVYDLVGHLMDRST